jgi:hypothetical protein
MEGFSTSPLRDVNVFAVVSGKRRCHSVSGRQSSPCQVSLLLRTSQTIAPAEYIEKGPAGTHTTVSPTWALIARTSL